VVCINPPDIFNLSNNTRTLEDVVEESQRSSLRNSWRV
jgi:hypothetical protein